MVGKRAVLVSPESRLAYECDALTKAKGMPDLVVIPDRHEQVAEVVRILSREKIPFVARGSGTSLAGGTNAPRGGATISLARLRRILELNPEDGYAVVEPGVVNSHLTRAASAFGLCYAPDPASQAACTIGGNVATNAGGPHTLKEGVTSNHILGFEMVLPGGETVQLGGASEDAPGYDLRGFFTGSEGTLGIVTKIWARLCRVPEAWKTLLVVFPTFEKSMRAVSAVIGAGIVPAALELMDRLIIEAVEKSFRVGLPTDAGAVLLIELDGQPEGMGRLADLVAQIMREQGASDVKVSNSEQERAALWSGRKKAGAAIGLLSPSYCTQDVVIPRSRLPEMAVSIGQIAAKYGVRIANLLHAGDGNLHPLILFDERDRNQVELVEKASHAVVERCIELGGSITGEHGVGSEKTGFMTRFFGPDDMEIMRRLKRLADPHELANPDKVLSLTGTPEAVLPRKQAAP